MRLRARLIGTGDRGDEYRVNLPTYRMLEVDYGQGFAIVEIPDTDHPFGNDAPNGKREMDPKHGPIQTSLTTAALNALHQHLDERYQEHKGKFRVEVV